MKRMVVYLGIIFLVGMSTSIFSLSFEDLMGGGRSRGFWKRSHNISPVFKKGTFWRKLKRLTCCCCCFRKKRRPSNASRFSDL